MKNDFNISDKNILILKDTKHLIAEESTDKIAKFIIKDQG